MKKTKDKEMPPPQIIPGLKIHKSSDDSIYGNIGTYQPTSKEKTTEAGSKERRSDKRFYFDDKTRKDKDETGTDKERGKDAKSDTVLEAERTLGALLKPGAADQITKVSRTHQRLSPFYRLSNCNTSFGYRKEKWDRGKATKWLQNYLLNRKDMLNAILGLKKWTML